MYVCVCMYVCMCVCMYVFIVHVCGECQCDIKIAFVFRKKYSCETKPCPNGNASIFSV